MIYGCFSDINACFTNIPHHQVTGRIITVDCETRTVRISLLPHIVGNRPYEFPDDVQVGKTFETAKIVTVHTRSGIVVDLPTQPIQKAFIYVRLSPLERLSPLILFISVPDQDGV